MPEQKNDPKGGGIHDGHRDRLREQFIKGGAENMPPHQVLELMLHNVIPRCDTNGIAHRLMERFGSFSAVLDARVEDLMQVNGMGRKSAVFIKLFPEVSRYYTDDKYSNGRCIRNPDDMGNYLLSIFSGCSEERFYMVCMDNTGKVKGTEMVAKGGINSVAADTRSVVRTALDSSCSCVVLAHNHPQGFAIPSEKDVTQTMRIIDALKLIGVTVNDHIIVADNDYVSMAQSQRYRHIFKSK